MMLIAMNSFRPSGKRRAGSCFRPFVRIDRNPLIIDAVDFQTVVDSKSFRNCMKSTHDSGKDAGQSVD